jgi:hypothetical protein
MGETCNIRQAKLLVILVHIGRSTCKVKRSEDFKLSWNVCGLLKKNERNYLSVFYKKKERKKE